MADELEEWEEEAEETATEEVVEAEVELPTDAASLKALLESTAAQAAEAAAAKVRAEEEAKFNERRSNLDRSKNQLLESLRANGLDVTEGGKIAPVDPQKALQLLLGAQPKAEEAATEEFDLYNQENFQRQLAARDEKLRKQTIEEVTKALGPQMQALSGMALATQRPLIEKAIADQFGEFDLAGAEKWPEWQQKFSEQLSVCDDQQKADPAIMKAVAMASFTALPDETRKAIREKAAKTRAEDAALRERQRAEQSRGQYQMSNPSRTVPGAPTQRAEFDPMLGEFDEIFQDFGSDFGSPDPSMRRAMFAPDLADGRTAVQALMDKRAADAKKARQTAGAR